MTQLTKNIVLVLMIVMINIISAEENIGSRKAVNKANTELAEEGTGKLYFTGPGYTVNLIPHAIVLGLLTFALVFLYGDALFGSTTDSTLTSGYGAPATEYGAPAPAYGAPAPSYSEPESTYGAPAPAYSPAVDTYGTPAAPAYGAPSSGYSAPSSSYSAANRYYDANAYNAASGLGNEGYAADGSYGQVNN